MQLLPEKQERNREDTSSPNLHGLWSLVMPPIGWIQLETRQQRSTGNASIAQGRTDGGQRIRRGCRGNRATSRAFMGMPLWLDIFVVPLTCGLLVGKNVWGLVGIALASLYIVMKKKSTQFKARYLNFGLLMKKIIHDTSWNSKADITQDYCNWICSKGERVSSIMNTIRKVGIYSQGAGWGSQ